jgi:hypothetical protein
MSRNLLIVLVVLCAGIAGLILFSGKKSELPHADPTHAAAPETATTTPAPNAPGTAARPAPAVPFVANNGTVVQPGTSGQPPVVAPASAGASQTGLVVTMPSKAQIPVVNPLEMPDTKPLPVLEKEYLANTNREDRLDRIMDITDWPGPETVKVLTRLFQAESDPELRVDLLDSLLSIEGSVDEKLSMLALATAKGQPTEVRQSAIDGLIDLEDPRVIPILNGLLNDPDEEIREGAKDAIEMLQTPPVTLK